MLSVGASKFQLPLLRLKLPEYSTNTKAAEHSEVTTQNGNEREESVYFTKEPIYLLKILHTSTPPH
jgi:hypothetical protein